MFLFPRPSIFTHGKRRARQAFRRELRAVRQGLSHTQRANELDLLKKEDGLVWQTHPRTKGSTGYPDVDSKEKDFFQSDRFLGGSFQSLPVDLSEKRLCEQRCFGLLDDMNNWAGPKYMLAEGDTYMKYPDDETFPQLMVNYVKLDRVPKFNEGWTPVVDALRAGTTSSPAARYCCGTGRSKASGTKRTYTAEAEWTFPPEFAELVWSDGNKVDRQVIDLRRNGALQQPQIPRCRSMRRERNGSDLLCGTRPETARSRSPCT